MKYETVIVGGGVAGLAAAAAAGRNALVLERMAQSGRKLLATGGGRCNITYDTDADGILSAFGRHGRFMSDALRACDPAAIRGFLAAHGVPTVVEADGCVFPSSGRAGDVLGALTSAAQHAGAKIQCGVRVRSIRLDEARMAVCGVEVEDGGFIAADRVVLAAGGRCRPELGSDGSGHALAAQAGLAVTPVYPALGGLHVAESWVANLAGLSCSQASLVVAEKGFSRQPVCGSLLFTHKGISGPPALSLSGGIAEALANGAKGVRLKIAFCADWTSADWLSLFDDWRRVAGSRRVYTYLAEVLPKSLAEQLCFLANVTEETVAAQLSRSQAERLADCCAACPLTVVATDGWARAMVTRGGVALNELDPRTLESRRIRGLFCAGEIVDLDAPCGGYNLTWALASGRLAGQKHDGV